MVAASDRVYDNLTACCGPDRNKWWGPFSDASNPDDHNGEYPGDYGWGAAGLAADPATFAAYREAELIHARRDMLGSLGFLNPELLAKYAGMQIDEPLWFKAGDQNFPESDLDYLDSSNLVHAQSFLASMVFQFVLKGAFKAYCVNGDPVREEPHLLHPGEAFDLLVLADDPDTFAELKVKEIKKERLAMLCIFRHYVQASATGECPVESWASRIALATLAHVFPAACALGRALAGLQDTTGLHGLQINLARNELVGSAERAYAALKEVHTLRNLAIDLWGTDMDTAWHTLNGAAAPREEKDAALTDQQLLNVAAPQAVHVGETTTTEAVLTTARTKVVLRFGHVGQPAPSVATHSGVPMALGTLEAAIALEAAHAGAAARNEWQDTTAGPLPSTRVGQATGAQPTPQWATSCRGWRLTIMGGVPAVIVI